MLLVYPIDDEKQKVRIWEGCGLGWPALCTDLDVQDAVENWIVRAVVDWSRFQDDLLQF